MDLICVKCEAESTALVVTQKQSNLTIMNKSSEQRVSVFTTTMWVLTKQKTGDTMHKSRNKWTSNSGLVNKALAASSLHAEAALAPRLLIIAVILQNA